MTFDESLGLKPKLALPFGAKSYDPKKPKGKECEILDEVDDDEEGRIHIIGEVTGAMEEEIESTSVLQKLMTENTTTPPSLATATTLTTLVNGTQHDAIYSKSILRTPVNQSSDARYSNATTFITPTEQQNMYGNASYSDCMLTISTEQSNADNDASFSGTNLTTVTEQASVSTNISSKLNQSKLGDSSNWASSTLRQMIEKVVYTTQQPILHSAHSRSGLEVSNQIVPYDQSMSSNQTFNNEVSISQSSNEANSEEDSSHLVQFKVPDAVFEHSFTSNDDLT